MIRVRNPQEMQIVSQRDNLQLDELSNDDRRGRVIPIRRRKNLFDHHDSQLAREQSVAVVLLHQKLLEVRLRVFAVQKPLDLLRVLGIYSRNVETEYSGRGWAAWG